MDQVIQYLSATGERTNNNQALRASIIIVNYNAQDKLLRCLASVLPTARDSAEVILVDNASSDGLADIVENSWPEVRLIRSPVNLGFGGGCNLGARAAQGKYLIFLNPDTLVDPGWHAALLAPLDADNRAGLATSRILMANDPDSINTCGNSVHITGLTLCRGLGLEKEALGMMEEVDSVSGAAFAIRRDLFELLKGFDEDTFLYMEDTDISLRARLAGWRVLYVPDSIVFHDYILKITPLKIYYQERNRYLMLLKNLSWPTLLVLLPAYLLAEIISWGFVLKIDRGNIGNKLRAYRWVRSNWSLVMRKRKQAQALRAVRDRTMLQHMTFSLEFDQVDKGMIGRLAGLILNPIFFVCKYVALAIVWWI